LSRSLVFRRQKTCERIHGLEQQINQVGRSGEALVFQGSKNSLQRLANGLDLSQIHRPRRTLQAVHLAKYGINDVRMLLAGWRFLQGAQSRRHRLQMRFRFGTKRCQEPFQEIVIDRHEISLLLPGGLAVDHDA
jgi:hypothetical protein